MAARKPLDPDCEGGIYCPVPGHVKTTLTVPGGKVRARVKFAHIPLTVGQRKTLRERRARHNHLTRDTKPLGQCPECDAYHERKKERQ